MVNYVISFIFPDACALRNKTNLSMHTICVWNVTSCIECIPLNGRCQAFDTQPASVHAKNAQTIKIRLTNSSLLTIAT